MKQVNSPPGSHLFSVKHLDIESVEHVPGSPATNARGNERDNNYPGSGMVDDDNYNLQGT